MKKTPGDIIILHKCTKNHDHMLYCSWDMVHDRCNCYFSFWTIFCPFTPLTARKMKISKKWKQCLETSSFYTSVPKIMIICYTVTEIWCVTDVIIFHFGPFFALLPPNSPTNENFKKMKKTPGILSLYTSVPKIMIIWYTVPEICCVRNVIIFSFWAIFLPFYPQLEKSKFKKTEENTWREHHFTHVYPKLWWDDVRFLINGAQQADGPKKWYIEVGVPPNKLTSEEQS